jgi:hypothetical protein
MPKIRKLKKEIKILTADLVNECLTFQHFNPDISTDKVDNIMKEILKKSSDINQKINLLRKDKDNTRAKKYFDGIIKEVNEKLIPIMDKLQDLKKAKSNTATKK